MRRVVAPLLTAVVAVAACGGGTVGPDNSGQPGVTILLGAGASDTIGAKLLQPLVVQVNDASGRPARGTVVRFQSPIVSAPFVPLVLLNRVGATTPGQSEIAVAADASGKATVSVEFYLTAGEGDVSVTVPTLGYSALAHYVVRAGQAVALTLAPLDTAITIGSSYGLRPLLRDRIGNRVDDAVTLRTISGPAVLQGGTVQGGVLGLSTFEARSGPLVATASATVLPPGELMVQRFGISSGQSPEAVVMNTDGSHSRTVMTGAYWSDMELDASPTAELFVFQGGTYNAVLFRSGMTGGVQRLIQSYVGLNAETTPVFSRDGAWIYFTGRPNHQNGQIWRVRPDGTGAEAIGPAVTYYDLDTQPAPSPDGTRVAFATNRTDFNTLYLRILTLSNGAVFDPGVRGSSPRWSPEGQWIAYMDDQTLKVMRPDGSGQRVLANVGGFAYVRQILNWSPDSKWIIVGRAAGLVIVDATTGAMLPIPGSAQLASPVWRR